MKPGAYRFGLFSFDAASGELRRQGAVVRLQGQPALALACLLANAGQVVTREDLCHAIWGSDTHVDFERGLNFCIGQIRFALGDDADAPRFIRTIPRRGYEFIAPVETVAPIPRGARRSEATQHTAQMLSQRGWRYVAISLAGAAMLLLLGLSAGYWLRSKASERAATGKGAAAQPNAARPPIVAVLRFDNETPDAAHDSPMTRFSDALTDSVVAQLTTLAAGRYNVIGNAAILRLPRQQRDLKAINAALHADYVILGQVQSSGGAQTRILAHLIRLPDQTHVRVVRMDRQIADSMAAESEAAERISGEFAPLLKQAAAGVTLPPALPPPANR